MSAEGGYADQPSAGGDAPREPGMPADERAPEGDPRAETLPDSDAGTLGTTSGDVADIGAGAPAAVAESDQPVTSAAERHDLPPNVVHPDAAHGWDRAVDLEKDPAVIPDLAETDVPEELKRTIEAAMARYPDRRSAVMPALHAAQALHGWCSPEALHQVSAVMRLTPAYLSMIASFYDQYNETYVGRNHVYVCTGVACMPKQPRRVLKALEDEAEAEALEDTEIRSFECLGACDMAPMASINGRYVGPLEPEDAGEIVDAIRAGRPPLPGRGLGDPEFRLPWGGRA
ncbi:MAG: NADH-quinone oxidoreductase subunit [Thermoleophilaceae bacterium]|jgi:NADH:ubiquinone oxidoreductase subunit E|nr:NADH-quinone oxidoreductase subunit [Thermoleophilaceae bacterium]